MPSIVTHHLFAKDIADKLKLNVNNNYYIFAQSHDYLYYSFNKKNRSLAHTFHVKNTQKYNNYYLHLVLIYLLYL